jgi:hypothetical protein
VAAGDCCGSVYLVFVLFVQYSKSGSVGFGFEDGKMKRRNSRDVRGHGGGPTALFSLLCFLSFPSLMLFLFLFLNM